MGYPVAYRSGARAGGYLPASGGVGKGSEAFDRTAFARPRPTPYTPRPWTPTRPPDNDNIKPLPKGKSKIPKTGIPFPRPKIGWKTILPNPLKEIIGLAPFPLPWATSTKQWVSGNWGLCCGVSPPSVNYQDGTYWWNLTAGYCTTCGLAGQAMPGGEQASPEAADNGTSAALVMADKRVTLTTRWYIRGVWTRPSPGLWTKPYPGFKPIVVPIEYPYVPPMPEVSPEPSPAVIPWMPNPYPMPIQQPVPEPEPIPWKQLPRLRPNRPQPGIAPGPWTPTPEGNKPPRGYRPPDTERPWPGGKGPYMPPALPPAPTGPKPPGKNNKEVKGNASKEMLAALAILAELLDAGLLVQDIVEAFYRALPGAYQVKWPTLQQMLWALYQHWDEVDFEEAVEGAIWALFWEKVGGKIDGARSKFAKSIGDWKMRYNAWGF